MITPSIDLNKPSAFCHTGMSVIAGFDAELLHSEPLETKDLRLHLTISAPWVKFRSSDCTSNITSKGTFSATEWCVQG